MLDITCHGELHWSDEVVNFAIKDAEQARAAKRCKYNDFSRPHNQFLIECARVRELAGGGERLSEYGLATG